MTASLILIACMSGDPQNCRREHLRAYGGCHVIQALMADWLDLHPQWRIVGTPRCRI